MSEPTQKDTLYLKSDECKYKYRRNGTDKVCKASNISNLYSITICMNGHTADQLLFPLYKTILE